IHINLYTIFTYTTLFRSRTSRELAQLRSRLAEQEQRESEQLDLRRHETVGHCREQRREMLQRWDEAEEQLTLAYESETVRVTNSIDQLGTKYRKIVAREKEIIQRKVVARCGAVVQQYENRRNIPGQQMRKECAQIDESLGPNIEEVEWARALAIRRLDHLPEVPPPQSPEEDVSERTPTSVREAIDAIGRLARRAKEINAEMQSGAASKTV